MHQVYQYLIPISSLDRPMSNSGRCNIIIRLLLMRQIKPMSTPCIMVRPFLCVECISHFGSLIMSVINKHMSYLSPTMILGLLCYFQGHHLYVNFVQPCYQVPPGPLYIEKSVDMYITYISISSLASLYQVQTLMVSPIILSQTISRLYNILNK